MPDITQNLQRETLRKIINNKSYADKQKQLAQLKLAYSEDNKLLTGYVNKAVNVNRLYLRHLPTQASGRWSTYDRDRHGSSITNWPRECINQHCPDGEHSWTEQCWSFRDILKADDGYVLVVWDHDNAEGRIHDLIINDQTALKAHIQGLDLHTITCCDIFGYEYPPNLRNPHSTCECQTKDSGSSGNSDVDMSVAYTHAQPDRCVHCMWRESYNWQGKDTRQRVLAKNFNHGSKYTTKYTFVYKIKGIEQYGVNYTDLGKLAKQYIASKGDAWQRKLDIMASIRQERVARSLYGFRRVFFNSTEETGREGFSHMVSATVSDYNNETLQLLEQWLGDDCILLHNAHDGNKLAVNEQYIQRFMDNNQFSIEDFLAALTNIIQRDITYDGRTIKLTAGVKLYA